MQRDTRFESATDAQVVRAPWSDDGHAPNHVVIPDAHLLFTAHFKKVGPDLLLVGDDGKKILVTDYFRSSTLPNLLSPDGARLSGDLVERLSVPEQPAQYAQAGAPAGAKVIGRVEKVTGTATVQHANGLVVELKVGDLIVQGDVVQTGDGSTLGIGMLDGTAFSMDANARMVLSDMVYDPNGSSNSALINIVQGGITFVAGKVAKTGDMKVATPVATMGIRGTTVISKYNVSDGTAEISLLPDQDGSRGVIAVLDNTNLSNVLYTITDTNIKLVIRPVGGGQVTTQVGTLSPAELSINAGFAQLVYEISNSISANPLTIDLQPRTAPSRGSGDTPPPPVNNDPDHNLSQAVQHDFVGKITFVGGVDPLLPIGSSYLVTFATAENLSVFSITPPAVIEAGVQGPGTPTSTVPIVLSDVDAIPSFDVAAMLANGWVGNSGGTLSQTGTYGTATLDPNTGNITFVLDNTKADDLSQGEHVTDVFNVLVKDDQGHEITLPVTFGIDGSNDTPTVSAPVALAKFQNDAPDTIDLLKNATDIDHGAVLHVENLGDELPAGITLDADGHTLHVDPSAYAYLPAGHQTVLQFTYDVVDEFGASVPQTATITIDGVNDPATIDGNAAGDVVEGGEGPTVAGGTLTVHDIDTGEAVFQPVPPAALSGNYGTFTFNETTGEWTYTVDPDKAVSLNEDEVVHDKLTVTSADGTAETVIDVSVTGTNEAAVLSADVRNLTETDSAEDISTSGQLSISDPDAGEAHFQAQSETEGQYGAFSIDEDGAWTYTANSAHDEFVDGQTYTDVFDVFSADGTHTSVTIHILGTNDTAALSADVRNLTETNSAANISTSGQLLISDADAGEAHFLTQNDIAGLYGTFSITPNGVWSYVANSAHNEFVGGQTYTDVFDVVSADGTHTSVTVHILGTNDTAVLSADVRNLTETNSAADISTSGQLSISDLDSGEAHFVTQNNTAGQYGKFSIGQDGSWTYTANSAHNEFIGGQTYTDVFDVFSADGTHSSVTIHILGTNDTAGLTADVRNLTETNSAADISTFGQLTVSDLDAGEAHFVTQSNTAGLYGKFSIGQDGSWTYTANSAHNEFIGGQTYTDVFDVVSADGTHTSVAVHILGTNDTAVLSADVRNLTETNSAADISTFGQLTISDLDAGEAHFQTQNNAAGQYGKFSIGQDGSWTYTANSAHNEFIGGQTYTDVFDVVSADGTHTSVTIHILGTNDTAILSADVRNLTETNSAADISTFGQLTVSDLDSGEAHFVTQSNTAGLYGKFSIGQDGAWTYTANSAHNEFIGGQTYTDVFDVVSADGTHTSVTIHILGTNDTAVLSADVRNLTETNSAADISTFGQLTISDLDAGEAHFVTQSNTAGLYGKFSIGQDGSWTYTANSAHNEFIGGQTYTDVFDVVSADGTQTSVTIHILGTNDSAIISGTASGTVVEAGGVGNATPGTPTATGTLTAADVDNTPNQFQAAAGSGSKGYGSYSITSAGVWLYTLNNAIAAVQGLNNGQQLTETFTVQTIDGTAQVVTITINGANDAAVISGTASGTVVEAGAAPGTPTATGTLTAADVDNTPNTFQAAAGSGANGFGTFTVSTGGVWVYTLDNANASVQGLNSGQHLTDTFTVLAADGTSQTVTITVNGANDAPAAVVDHYATDEDKSLTVAAASGVLFNDTDVDTQAASLKAVLDSGPAHGVLVLNQNGSFTYTPELNFNGTDTFTYHVNDGSLSSAPTTVSIDVAAVNDKPIIFAPSELDYWTASAGGNVTPINHIEFQDADAGNGSVTVTLSFATGNVLTATDIANDGVGVAGSGSNVVTLTGSISAINAYIAGNNVQFNPAGNSFPIGDQTLTININDNGLTGGSAQSATAQMLLHSLSPNGGSSISLGDGDDFRDFHGVNMNGITSIHLGGGNNTIITSSSNFNVVTYDTDDTGGPDTGTLVFTPDQLAQILSDTSSGGFESKLQSYLDGDPGTGFFADTLDLSASSWKAIVGGLETAWVALATNDDYVVYTAIGDNLPDLRSNQTGTNGDDTLVATAGHPNLSGGNGNDILVGTSSGSTLDGGAGADLLLGSGGNDSLTGGGGNDIMWGGKGSDTFKFAPNFGQDTILDFHPGEDVIEIDDAIFANFSDLVAHASDNGQDVTIDTGSGSTITLKDLVVSVLHANDFHFV